MSDEVSQFLEQVERLRGQQIEDDEMRAREREEFLAAKRERQARREERARSISPQKSSPAATPSPHANRRTVYLAGGLRLDSPGHDPLDKMREKLVEPGKPGTITTVTTTEIDAPPLTPSDQDSKDSKDSKESRPGADFSTTPSKGSPFPWQRRPSRVGGARPLSMIATHNATERSRIDPGLQDSPVSRDQIAQSLASHDPSWFRQTPDRGATSAAYRKNQVEVEVEVEDDDRLDLSPARAQLPGMATESRESPAPERTPVLAEPLLPLLPQLTGRPSALRSGSPTKGMGGFVQSALMKRSDSVKRWSVASPAGLTRGGDSIATNRASVAHANAAPAPRPKSVIDTSITTTGTTTAPPLSARPASRHNEKEHASFEPVPSVPSDQNPPKTPTRTSPIQTRRIIIPEEDPSLPLSPSKTMDPRRWSPIKSSWLESALNRPEVPRKPPQHSKVSSQPPAWMAELNKTRERPGHRHQVSISGLKTSSPMGTVTTLTPKGLGGIYSAPVAGNNRASTLNLGLVPESSSTTTTTTTTSSSSSSSSHPSHLTGEQNEGVKGREDPKLERKASVLSSSATASAAAKPKPVTPPKKDFRANLKPRAPEPQDTKSAEPEFKAVFGTLRRAKTQNFKAPDELKDNILRGKASLNLTDGPHKSVIRDDFKEAILRKKASFARAKVEGKGVITNAAAASTLVENPMPEGLAKRAEIRHSQTIPASARQSAPALTPVRSPPRSKPEPEPREVIEQPNPQAPATSPRDLRTKKSAPSRLGDRFNPALAGLLARGPPIESINGGGRKGETGPAAGSGAEPSGPGPQLTHMTKNRARGPKRRAPTTAPSTPTASAVSLPDFGAHAHRSAESLVESRPGSISAQVQQAILSHRRQPTVPEKIVTDLVMPLRPLGENATPQAESPRKLDLKRMSKFMDARTPTSDAKPGLTHGRTGSWSPTKTERQVAAESVQTTTTTTTPRRHLRGESIQSVKNAAAMFGGSAVKSPLSPMPGPRTSTLFLPQESASLAPVAQKVPPPRPLSPKPVMAAKPVSPKALPAQTQEPTSPRAANLFNDFFDLPHRRKPFEVDTSEILNSRQDLSLGAKINTISFQMSQVNAEGKQIPIQQQNQRVLFEQEMYLASHIFTNEAGWKVREMYLWVGDDVPPDHALEATHSALREVEHAGSKLVSMSQGKETAEFLQALGGVVLVRRRSSIKYDSLAPSMLCGRRHLGQVVFDEVDFECGSLCSGFAYLIAHSGNCFLWKGKGSAVEELSCARLVGMELSLTGELVEYEDGGEPARFWEMLNGGGGAGAGAHSADHWRLKPSYERYASRLFCADEDSKHQIHEIASFTQLDLSPSHIYILDAFFEIYIIVGSRAQSRYASFRNALDFAQEYAIVAAGAEDRPFVPISTVVLEGAPRDLKRVFRKWVDRHCPTVLNGSGGGAQAGSRVSGPALRRVRSLKIVPLTQALMALQE